MHIQAKNFTIYIKKNFPDYFIKKTVLDVGSGDINGNNRFLFEDCEYHGNDVISAPNVTIVSKTKDLKFEKEIFDTIVSTECFEHDPEYMDSFLKIYDMLKPDGLFFFTCANTGRPEHGTRRTTPRDSFGTIGKIQAMQDYYKNLVINDIDQILSLNDIFSVWSSYENKHSKDLYFWGIKKGLQNHDKVQDYTDAYVVKNN